jgi:hypothetical protein
MIKVEKGKANALLCSFAFDVLSSCGVNFNNLMSQSAMRPLGIL